MQKLRGLPKRLGGSPRRIVGMWMLLLTVSAISLFALGRFSTRLVSPLSSVSVARTGALGRLMGADGDGMQQHPRPHPHAVVSACTNPFDMYDNEGIDDDGDSRNGSTGGGDGAAEEKHHHHRGIEEPLHEVFDGVRHFVDKCIVQGSDRTDVVPREKVSLSGKRRIVDHAADDIGFLVRDVCALGHFPKDLAHMHSWMERHRMRQWMRRQQPSHTSDDAKAHTGRHDDDGVNVVLAGETNPKQLEALRASAPQWLRAMEESGSIQSLIIGHRCATKDSRRIFNKRTPVFHNVLIHWVRALSCNYSLLASTASVKGSKRCGLERPLSTVFYEDLDDEVHCFKHILEREERWRWFPTVRAAHSFREKMWAYLNVNFSSLHALRHEVPLVQQRKLQILVLHRDEDRHFEEKRVVAFLKEKFGQVADIRYEQYDAPPNPRKITAENNITVPFHPDQLRQLFETDVLIAAHGAALSNVVVMQPGAVVIELFPHNFRYYMYEELCRVMSLNYVAFESETVFPAGCCKAVRWKRADEQGDANPVAGVVADASAAIFKLNGKRDCKKCSIMVKDEQWYQMVKSAMASVWLRNSRLRNVHDFDVRR